MRNLHQIINEMASKNVVQEVEEPRGEAEKNFKNKHEVSVKADAAGNSDEVFKGAVTKKKKRKADYESPEDEIVYEETEELSERIQSKEVAIKEISSMISMNASVVKDALAAAKLDPLAVLTALRGKKSIKPIQVSNIVQSHVFGGSIDKKDLEPVKKAAVSAFKATVKEETEGLVESHFEVGDEVKCLESGMSGKVVKLDKPEVGKYYTVKREDGKTMKYSGEELKSGKNIDEKSLSPKEEKKKEYIVKGMKKDKDSLKDKYGDDWKSVMYATATKRAQESMSESVEVSHDRYMRSHGKKASGRGGMWMFTHKRSGDVDYENQTEVFQPKNFSSKSFTDAAKEAKEWAKKNGHSTIYVMESLDEEQLEESTKIDEYELKTTGKKKTTTAHPNGKPVYDILYKGEKVGTVEPYSAYKDTKKPGARIVSSRKEVTRYSYDFEQGKGPGIGEVSARSKHGHLNAKHAFEHFVMMHSRWAEKNMNEAKKMKDDPCWDDYEMIGKKKKNGKEVPNCVPKEEVQENYPMAQSVGMPSVSYEYDHDNTEIEFLEQEILSSLVASMNIKLQYVFDSLDDGTTLPSYYIDTLLTMRNTVNSMYQAVLDQENGVTESHELDENNEFDKYIDTKLEEKEILHFLDKLSEKNQAKAKKMMDSDEGLEKLKNFIKKHG